MTRIDGYPHIISELGWPSPNRYRADATFLASAYASLQGLGGLFFFAIGSNFLNDMSISKFSLSTPLIAGAFPAAALQYRRGDVRTPEPVVYQALRLDDLYAMKGSGAVTAQALDALRQADVPGDREITGAVNQLDPLAFYTGPVVRTFLDDPSVSHQQNLLDEINRASRTVTSLTGELAWAYGKGLATVDTPRSQGASGFLARAGRIELADVTLDVRNEFASVMVTSLDGRSLGTSKKILIQALTEEQPYGFRAENGRITDLGGPPFGVRVIDATVTLRLAGGDRARVVALDENGYARPDPVHVAGNGVAEPLQIELRKDAIYHVVLR